MQRRIYLDYASATPLRLEVLRAMGPFWSANAGNPGALHAEGVVAKRAVDKARESIARILHAHTPEIIFTGSGTEANNLGIFGVIAAHERMGIPLSSMHLITGATEHDSVLNCFHELHRRGAMVSIIAPDAEGTIPTEEILRTITPRTILISLQAANHEIGIIQHISQLAKGVRDVRESQGSPLPFLHTDASQAAGLLNVAVDRLQVDLMTLDAQKIYGPKGVGALYIRQGVTIAPLYFGGGQERGLRPGTENVPLIVGFAKAFELTVKERDREWKRLLKLQELFLRLLEREVPQALLNGGMENRLPSNLNISLPGHSAEMLALSLDAKGFAVTTKSACSEALGEESAVVLAVTGDSARAKSSLRFSFGKETTAAHLHAVVTALALLAKGKV